MKNLQLLLIEDEEMLLEFYREMASNLFQDIFCAQTIMEARTILSQKPIDCIFADNRLPDGQCIDLLERLNNSNIIIPSIIITAHPEKDILIKAINTHIIKFLEKPTSHKVITQALQQLKESTIQQKTNSELQTHYILSNQAQKLLINQYLISKRELELISHALHPLENHSIAKKMNISNGTVRRHLENIFRKLNITSRLELRSLITQLNKTSGITEKPIHHAHLPFYP